MKNILAPLAQLAKDPQSTPRPNMTSPTRSNRRLFETPNYRETPRAFPIESAMKGVILTTTGEPLPTPMPSTRLVDLLNESPKVGAGGSLGFSKIFDFDKLDDDDEELNRSVGGTSPSKRKADAIAAQTQAQTQAQGSSVPASAPTLAPINGNKSPSKRKSVGTSARSLTLPVPTRSAPAPPSQTARRLRRPSVSSRTRAKAPKDTSESKDSTGQSSSSQPPSSVSTASSSSASSSSSSSSTRTVTSDTAPPTYNLQDEENLPSPFLRRVEREPPRAGATTFTRVKRPSGANLLRVAAAANNAKAAGSTAGSAKAATSLTVGSAGRSSVVRRPGEEARRTLLRM